MSTFMDFQIHPKILSAIKAQGFETPTPVQEKAIPHVLSGRDVISLAETGSGKTAAYLIPTLTQVLNNPEAHVLILAPTRELAVQIGSVIRDLLSSAREVHSVVLIGGAAMSVQVRGLRTRPRLIVATPGRLMDHLRQRTLDLKKTTTLILDEADRMFDMGFAPQVNQILKHVPAQRQTHLFSATFPKEVRTLAANILKNPIEIEVRKNERPPIVIEQKVVEVDNSNKNDRTLDLINAAKGSVVIFTRTKSRTDRLTRYLEGYGVKVARIHGDRSQGQRNKSIQDFKSGLVNVLVATDIAARGLDVPSISDVINYDLPQNSEDYVHRIGRTGRAGQAGQALTLVTPEDRNDWYYIAKKMGLAVDRPPQGARQPHGGGGGGRSRHQPRQQQQRAQGGGGKTPQNNKGGARPHRGQGPKFKGSKPKHSSATPW